MSSTLPSTRLERAGSALALALMLALPSAFALVPAHAAAQQVQPGSTARTVQGKVVEGGSGAAGAIVYLKDTKTLAIRSFIADAGGAFHFGQLSQSTDYEVWAESKGQRSKTKRISSFDNKSVYDFTLEL